MLETLAAGGFDLDPGGAAFGKFGAEVFGLGEFDLFYQAQYGCIAQKIFRKRIQANATGRHRYRRARGQAELGFENCLRIPVAANLKRLLEGCDPDGGDVIRA